MEILDDLRDEIKALRAEIQQVKQLIGKPPVVNVDTAPLARAVTKDLDDYTRSGNAVVARIEAAAATIPKKLEYGLNASTRLLLYSMGAMLLTGLFFGYLFTPDINESANKRLSAELAEAKHQLYEKQVFENYFRKKHPRDAARYDQAIDQWTPHQGQGQDLKKISGFGAEPHQQNCRRHHFFYSQWDKIKIWLWRGYFKRLRRDIKKNIYKFLINSTLPIILS